MVFDPTVSWRQKVDHVQLDPAASYWLKEALVKALCLHLGSQPKGSVVSRLLKELPGATNVDKQLVESGKVLDTFYIPTRCPDTHIEGAPIEQYGPLQSQGAIACATRVLEFVQRTVDAGRVTDRKTRQRK